MMMYSYSEISETFFDKKLNPPFAQSETAIKYLSDNHRIFKLYGGVQVIDYSKNEFEFVRITLWTSADGYQKWASDPIIEKYLAERDKYHHIRKIKSQLTGPTAVNFYE